MKPNVIAQNQLRQQRETKRRLLLSKWRRELPEDGEAYERLHASLTFEQQELLDEIIANQNDAIVRQESALERVKYWLLDTLTHHRPVSDPRRILRTVEDAIQ